MKTVIQVLFFIFFLSASSITIAEQAENEKVFKLTAPAKRPAVIFPNQTQKYEFDFGDIKATVDSEGNARVNGLVRHNRIRCANYQIGLRLGQGEYACTNVKWLTEPVYLTFRKHCNSVQLEHTAHEKVDQFGMVLSKVTCAQRLIRCTGVCN